MWNGTFTNTNCETSLVTLDEVEQAISEFNILYGNVEQPVIVATPRAIKMLADKYPGPVVGAFLYFQGVPVYEEKTDIAVSARMYELRKSGKKVFPIYDPPGGSR